MRRRDFCRMAFGAVAIFPPLGAQAMRLGEMPKFPPSTIPVQEREGER